MQDYQRAFLDFALEAEALRFGEFELKSGRISPYFFNAGQFSRGSSLAKLGGFYAQAIVESGVPFDIIYGPAYKGIPLATITAAALYTDHGRDLPYAFNRKETKDHGEGGQLVGHPLSGRVLIIDDVISAGTSIRESLAIIHAAGAEAAGVAIALDRQERGTDGRSAVDQVEEDHGVPVTPIARLEHLVSYLADRGQAEHLERIRDYRARYGV